MIVYWLGGAQEAAVIRGNFIGYFTLLSLGSFWTYVARGLFTPEVDHARAVHRAGAGVHDLGRREAVPGRRRPRPTGAVAYLIIAMVAVASMPVLDGVWR